MAGKMRQEAGSRLEDLYRESVAFLNQAGIENASLEVRLILQHRAGLGWADIIANPGHVLGQAEKAQILSDLERRITGEPLARIHGAREFWGLEFYLNEATLDPRPDTELLVERALSHFAGKPPPIFLDLGTGSGCIAIALLKEWPEAVAVVCDYSESALHVAVKNARRHDVAARFLPLCGDWAGALRREFPLILSNPPYIAVSEIQNLESGVRDFDPILALEGGENGLQAYQKIFEENFHAFQRGGKGLLEIGFNQAEDVMRLAANYGFSILGVRADLAGHPRVVEISRGDK